MPLPTLTKTWQFQVNQTMTGAAGSALDLNRTWVRGLKDTLMGFASSPWTMRYSCNSVTAGTAGDGVDRITTNANLVWANAGVAHSWYVLRQTGIASNFELLVSCENSAASGTSLIIAVSPSAGFTGGSTTARPTATDENVLATAWGNGSTGVTYRVHAQMSSDGQCTRVSTWNAGAQFNLLKLEKPYLPTTGWTNPSVVYANQSITSHNMATLCATVGNMRARINGTDSAIVATVEGTNSGPVPSSTFGTLANEITNEWPIFPIGFGSVTVGSRGRHGTFQDLWFGSTNANSGDTYPNAPTNLFAQLGNLVWPWNGSTVSLS